MGHPMIGDGRAIRVCDLCGGVDDHPRHVIAGGVEAFPAPDDDLVATVMSNAREAGIDDHTLGRVLRDLYSTAAQDRHMDCCRMAGCPTGACDQTTEGAEDLVGAELLEHLVTLPSTVTAAPDPEPEPAL